MGSSHIGTIGPSSGSGLRSDFGVHYPEQTQRTSRYFWSRSAATKALMKDVIDIGRMRIGSRIRLNSASAGNATDARTCPPCGQADLVRAACDRTLAS